ncbi:MAG: DUF262 domain-containing protein [Desulfomonilaceae bacterium]
MRALASNQTLNWFFQRFKEDSLELSPEFQRKPVWLLPAKRSLIETILLELPIPEIYLVNRISAEGEAKYVIVDGQQRLRSILEFISKEITFKDGLEKFPYIKSFSELTEDDKKRFWRYPIVVRDLEDSTDNEIRNLFERLNRYSVQLNEQEIRNARFKGEFIKTVQELSDHDFWTSSGIFSAADIRRMLDLEFISVLLATLLGGIFHRKDRLDEFYVNYEDEFEESNYYKNKFFEILQLIDLMVPNMKKTRWRKKADFYTLFIVIDSLIPELDSDLVTRLGSTLQDFENQVEAARETEDPASAFYAYWQASYQGTNDKESRWIRFRILRSFIKEDLKPVQVESDVI